MRSFARLVPVVSLALVVMAGAADAGARTLVAHPAAATASTSVHHARRAHHAHHARHAARTTLSATRAAAHEHAPAPAPARTSPHHRHATAPARVRLSHRDPRPGARTAVLASAVRVERPVLAGGMLGPWEVVEEGTVPLREAGRGPPRASPSAHSRPASPARAHPSPAPAPGPLPDPHPSDIAIVPSAPSSARARVRASARAASNPRAHRRPRRGTAIPEARRARVSAVRPGARRRLSTAPSGGNP